MYEYFKSHNIFRPEDVDGGDSGDFYQSFDTPDDNMDDLATQIKLQTITADTIYDNDDRDPEEREREKVALYVEERTLAEDPVLLALPVFDYTKLLPDQYIKFSDSDIPSLLDYIFLLRTTKTGPIQHETKVPAAIVFQLLRYAHMKAESTDLTEFLFDCFIARLRSVTNTKSGVFTGEVINNTQDNKDGDSGSANGGDIVLLSYWLSVIQFLHFYLSKNNLYKSYPKFLQELINTVQSLIATMSFSVNTRLNLLVDECVLDFTNLVDVSNALYAKDWNLSKRKRSTLPRTMIFSICYTHRASVNL